MCVRSSSPVRDSSGISWQSLIIVLLHPYNDSILSHTPDSAQEICYQPQQSRRVFAYPSYRTAVSYFPRTRQYWKYPSAESKSRPDLPSPVQICIKAVDAPRYCWRLDSIQIPFLVSNSSTMRVPRATWHLTPSWTKRKENRPYHHPWRHCSATAFVHDPNQFR